MLSRSRLDLWKIIYNLRNYIYLCVFKIQNMQVIQMMSSNIAKWCHQMLHCCIATTVVLSTRASNLWRSRPSCRNFFLRKYSTQCVIVLFLLISARQLCPMSYAESHALYARKVSKTYHSTLCFTSVERYMYISYQHFGKPSLGNFNCFSLTFTYLIPSILFLVCTLKPHVPSDLREHS